MTRVKLATPEEKAAYDGIYPLHGFLAVDGVTCPVEYLGDLWDKDDPQYEILAPAGKQFDGLHTLPALTLKDLYERVGGYPLRDCPDNCDCKSRP